MGADGRGGDAAVRVAALWAVIAAWCCSIAAAAADVPPTCTSPPGAKRLNFKADPYRELHHAQAFGDPAEFDVVLPPLSADAEAGEGVGLSLSPDLVVVGFVRSAGGELLAAERTGLVRVGDGLRAVNGVRVDDIVRLRSGAEGSHGVFRRLCLAAGVRVEEVPRGPVDGPQVVQALLRGAAKGPLPTVLTMAARGGKVAPGLAVPGDYAVRVDASRPLGLVLDGSLVVRRVLDGRTWPGADGGAQWEAGWDTPGSGTRGREDSGGGGGGGGEEDEEDEEEDGTPAAVVREAKRLFASMGHAALGQLARVGRVMPGDRVVAVGDRSLLGMRVPDAVSLFRDTFNASGRPSVELRCGGSGDGAGALTHCSEVRIDRPPRPVVLTLRPPMPWADVTPRPPPGPRVDGAGSTPGGYGAEEEAAELAAAPAPPVPPLPDLVRRRSAGAVAEARMRRHLPKAKLACGIRGCAFAASDGVLRALSRADAVDWWLERAQRWVPGEGAVGPGGALRPVARMPPRGAVVAPFRAALFGGRFLCRARRLVAAVPLRACEPLLNADAVRGSVVLVLRGGCSFAGKAEMAARAGAAAVVVVDSSPGRLLSMPAPAPGTGPSVGETDAVGVAMVSSASGARLLRALETATSGSLLAQFGTAASPEEDVCHPLRQRALSRPPRAAHRELLAPEPRSVLEAAAAPRGHEGGVAEIGPDGAQAIAAAPADLLQGLDDDWDEEDEDEDGWFEQGAPGLSPAAAEAYARMWAQPEPDAPLE